MPEGAHRDTAVMAAPLLATCGQGYLTPAMCFTHVQPRFADGMINFLTACSQAPISMVLQYFTGTNPTLPNAHGNRALVFFHTLTINPDAEERRRRKKTTTKNHKKTH